MCRITNSAGMTKQLLKARVGTRLGPNRRIAPEQSSQNYEATYACRSNGPGFKSDPKHLLRQYWLYRLEPSNFRLRHAGLPPPGRIYLLTPQSACSVIPANFARV